MVNDININELNQEVTLVLNDFSSQGVRAAFLGYDNYRSLYIDLLNLHCLCGYVSSLSHYNYAYYLGLTFIPEDNVHYVRSMVQYYANREVYDVSTAPDYSTGSITPVADIVLNYRAGSSLVAEGSNTILFKVDNINTPFATAAYIVHAWAIGNDGSMQNNLVLTNKVAAGFTASDVMDAGTLYYEAVLIT